MIEEIIKINVCVWEGEREKRWKDLSKVKENSRKKFLNQKSWKGEMMIEQMKNNEGISGQNRLKIKNKIKTWW